MSDDPARPDVPGVAFPETSAHEPTVRPWELELLISGAVVYALAQLPGRMDDAYTHVLPHLGGRSHMGAVLLFMYGKMALYALLGGFVLHLAGRAYWVGLIGLETVFPHGIRWDDTSYGPVMREVFRGRMGRLQARIDAADRFCSVLFPVSFTLAMLAAYSTVLLVIVSAVAFALSRVPGAPGFDPLFATCFAAVLAVPLLAMGADRLWGARARPDGRAGRTLRRLAGAAYWVNAMPVYGTVFLTLYTNVGRRKRTAAYLGLMAALFAVVVVKDVMAPLGAVQAGGVEHLPDEAGVFGVDADVYEDQRAPGPAYDRVPSIPTDVVRGPYVRLFIPYRPIRHGDAFREQCPGVRPLSAAGLRMQDDTPPDAEAVRAVLDCWLRLQPVTLNGAPLRADFRFYTHPRTGVRGIVAYLPTEEMPRGENLITVAPAPRTAAQARKRARQGDPSTPSYIRFWR